MRTLATFNDEFRHQIFRSCIRPSVIQSDGVLVWYRGLLETPVTTDVVDRRVAGIDDACVAETELYCCRGKRHQLSQRRCLLRRRDDWPARSWMCVS